MGKIKRVRVKRHIEAAKPSESTTNAINFTPNESGLPALFPVNNLFQVSLDDVDKETTITIKETAENDNTLSSKKDRRRNRHEKFLKKLNASKVARNEVMKTKQREQTVITGDMNPLTQALLDIENLTSSKKTSKKRPKVKKQGPKPTNSNRDKKLKQRLGDIEKFQQVLANPFFQKNPLTVIQEHVKNIINENCNNIS